MALRDEVIAIENQCLELRSSSNGCGVAQRKLNKLYLRYLVGDFSDRQFSAQVDQLVMGGMRSF
ncbi:hypothetical protein AVDCRST_MAG94-7128 [uncultured Leptolyngbya sp.]|uniref:Uncharacterized protein n=1 Tax=uncultured Leptolyngbya sp. TaxID=332963 RepID=A0A6J4PYN7_9CYAN|nr:hypothetical protein AVDCRST_MAG94-7128 [uncultured Leptolyngbya sp.]